MQFCFYSLAIALANENLDQLLRVPVAGMLVVMFGTGATCGALMDHAGPRALYQFALTVSVIGRCLSE